MSGVYQARLTLDSGNIKVELDNSFDFEGFPGLFINPKMDWEQLEKELTTRNLIKQEVEENIEELESLKSKVTYSSYNFVEKAVNGLIQDIKLIQSEVEENIKGLESLKTKVTYSRSGLYGAEK